jgi:hypothetical protein
LLVPLPASAWGPKGHVIVARIAELRLTPEAQRAVAALLNSSNATTRVTRLSDEDVPNWADYVRPRRPDTAPWHYVDIPFAADRYDPVRDCGNHKGCIIDAIRDGTRLLGDAEATGTERLEALKFVAHLVGDEHQPLHCAERNDDKGGNLCRGLWPGESRPEKLHVIWDIHLPRKNLRDAQLDSLAYADKLNRRITDEQAEAWRAGDAAAWAWEAHGRAITTVYAGIPDDGSPAPLNNNYIRAGQALADEQLSKAGVRLARILNEVLSP